VISSVISTAASAIRSRRWPADSGPLVVVWGVWLVLVCALFHYVRTFSIDAPWMDEWELVPVLTGHQPITWKWLWSQHNEHRIVIPRLIYLAVVKASGDFRAGCWFDASALAVSAAAMSVVARRLRGHALYSDAFFSVVALHFGQWENLLFSLHVVWLSAAALVTALLLIIVQPGRLGLRASLALGLCTVLLPLCGGNGLAFAPACAIMVFLVGWQVRTVSRHGRWATAAVWALGVLALAITALYFVDYTRPAKHPPGDDLKANLDGAAQFLSVGLGTAAKTTWPNVKFALYASTLAITLAMAGAFLWHPEERPRICRLVLLFGGVCSLAFGTSWARRMLFPGMLFSPRYATAAAAFWFVSYFAWEVVERPAVRRTAQALLFALGAAFLVANRNEGLVNADHGRAERLGFRYEVETGVPLEAIAATHWNRVYYDLGMSISKESPAGRDTFRERLKMLKESRFGMFRALK
jgi:hypothetical protein